MRLLSYNIHKGIGGRDRRYRLERIFQVIADEHPDMVCLQEVDRNVARTRHDDQPRKLRRRWARWPISISSTCGSRRVVTATWCSRGGRSGLSPDLAPPTETKAARRRSRSSRRPRGPLHVVHWHLGLAERERHWQVRHLLEHALFRESAHLPTLIVGDFNDWLNTLARNPFAHHGFAQVTMPRSRFRSFPAYWPLASLDKAFVRGPVEIRHARIVHSRLARDASDHLPLVIDFHLNPVARR